MGEDYTFECPPEEVEGSTLMSVGVANPSDKSGSNVRGDAVSRGNMLRLVQCLFHWRLSKHLCSSIAMEAVLEVQGTPVALEEELKGQGIPP